VPKHLWGGEGEKDWRLARLEGGGSGRGRRGESHKGWKEMMFSEWDRSAGFSKGKKGGEGVFGVNIKN